MRNTLFDGYLGPRLPRQLQLQRVRQVIERELTPLQKETLIAYYIQGQTIPEIARERGVQKSTISRTLHRAEEKLRRFLKSKFTEILFRLGKKSVAAAGTGGDSPPLVNVKGK